MVQAFEGLEMEHLGFEDWCFGLRERVWGRKKQGRGTVQVVQLLLKPDAAGTLNPKP